MQVVRVRLIEESNLGCELAPVEILKELRNVRKLDVDKLNLEEIHVNLEDRDEANHLIFENGKELFEKNDRCFFVGGDNSINYSLMKGFDKTVNGMVVVFDAHTQCDEDGWVRRIVENGFNGRKVILIGCRNVSNEELKFIREEEISLIDVDVLNEDLEGVCDMVMERLKDNDFYIDVNMNVVDPAFCPGVCDIESGGISSSNMLYFAKRLSLIRGFRGGGVVGVNPSKDFNGITINLASRLLGEMII